MAVKAYPNNSHFDGNQVPSIMGVEGTLGTADVSGTAKPLPIGVNPATGAMYVQDLSGASGTTNVQGSVQVTGGTITVANPGSNVNIVTGTIQSSGTTTGVGVVSSLTNGSVNILTGTIQSSGTTTGVGVVSNLTNGSVNILTGTVTSITNIAGGTVQLNPRPSRSIFTYGTTTTGTIGTLVNAGGAGVRIFVNDCSISSHNGTVDAIISWGLAVGGGGATGGGVVARGNFGAQGGIQKSFPYPTDGGTSNVALTFNQLGGAGTVTYTVSFWTE